MLGSILQKQLMPRPVGDYSENWMLSRGYERLSVDNLTCGWLKSPSRPKAAICFFCGNGENAEGWLEIDELIRRANKQGQRLDRELLDEVVATSDKARFAVSDDGTPIRANQGHSIVGVDLQLEAVEPPPVLFHGTVAAALPSIQQRGPQKQSRNHVHLSADEKTATKVGARRGKPIILRIAAASMHEQGHLFYRSANGVWLVVSVPREFVEFPG